MAKVQLNLRGNKEAYRNRKNNSRNRKKIKLISPFVNEKDESEADDNMIEEREDDEEVSSESDLVIRQVDQPGLYVELPYKTKLEINNSDALKSKFNDFKLNANWIERLDLSSDLDSLPAHIPNPLKDQTVETENNDLDIIRNDIKREIKFMLQAKSSVLQGLARLHALKVKTKRPDDYLAEMLKSKEHMNKIQKVKDNKKELVDKKEKAKLLREQKKMGKKVQQEVLKQRQKEKKEFQEKIKKFRKGNIKSTDFLENDKKNKRGDRPGGQLKKRNAKLTKKEFKASKFGYGGRKTHLKRNTSDSSASFASFKPSRNSMDNKRKGKKRRK